MKKHGMEPEEYRRLWMARLTDLEESGLTQKQWCGQNDIPYSTLKYWTLKINKEKSRHHREGDKKWLAVEVGSLTSEARCGSPAPGAVSVNYGGFRVDIDAGADPGQTFNILRMIKEL